MKGAVKIAYWDTAQGNPPRLVGQIRGTPTIKFIYPNDKKNKRNTNKKKIVSDYNGERKAQAMYEFAAGRMPNYLNRISSTRDLEKFGNKADQYALPKVILVTKEPRSSTISKSLSTTFRRRALVAEVRATKPNKEVIEKLGLKDWLSDSSAPKTVAVAFREEGLDGVSVPMKKKGQFVKFRLSVAEKFFAKVALQKPYYEDEHAQAVLKARQEPKEEAGETPKTEL